MVSHRSMSDSKSPQVSRNFFNVLADLNNAVVLDGLHSSSYFQVLQFLYQYFVDGTRCTSYNWYYRHFHVHGFIVFFTSLADHDTQTVVWFPRLIMFRSVIFYGSYIAVIAAQGFVYHLHTLTQM